MARTVKRVTKEGISELDAICAFRRDEESPRVLPKLDEVRNIRKKTIKGCEYRIPKV